MIESVHGGADDEPPRLTRVAGRSVAQDRPGGDTRDGDGPQTGTGTYGAVDVALDVIAVPGAAVNEDPPEQAVAVEVITVQAGLTDVEVIEVDESSLPLRLRFSFPTTEQVVRCPKGEKGIVTEMTNGDIARMAEKATNATRRMVVVDN